MRRRREGSGERGRVPPANKETRKGALLFSFPMRGGGERAGADGRKKCVAYMVTTMSTLPETMAVSDTFAHLVGAATVALAVWSFIESHPLLTIGSVGALGAAYWYLGSSRIPLQKGRDMASYYVTKGSGFLTPVQLLLLSVFANGLIIHKKQSATLSLALLTLATVALYARTCDPAHLP